MENPTAVQAVADVQETPFRVLKVALLSGGLSAVHVEPFQTSASGASRRALFAYHPTAMQNAGEVHETPDRPLPLVGLLVGGLWIVHLVPSQNSASSSPAPGPEKDPIAVQNVDEVHETAFSVLDARTVALAER